MLFQEERPQGIGESIVDILNISDQARISGYKNTISSLESELNSLNAFEEFVKTYDKGTNQKEINKLKKQLSQYFK